MLNGGDQPSGVPVAGQSVGSGNKGTAGAERLPPPGRNKPGSSAKIIRGRLRWMALIADLPPAAQITRFEAGILGDSRQHPGTNLLAIMECKDIVRVVRMFKSLVRSCLTLDSAHNGLQGC